MGHHGKAIAFAKSSPWVKNWNSKKHVKIHSTNHLELVCAKKRPKKHQIFDKWDHFENGPSCKGYYSLCKILTLGQKLKFQQTCQIILSCSEKKTARKNTKYSRIGTTLKIGHHAGAIAFVKFSLWAKN